MSAKLSIVVTCGAPGCAATLTLDPGRFGSVNECPRSLPRDWVWHGVELQACPEHAEELTRATRDAFRWASRRMEALNKARRAILVAHPTPDHPTWLSSIYAAREREL